MRQKLNIALLTVLVLFQTILMPFGSYGVAFGAGNYDQVMPTTVIKNVDFKVAGKIVNAGDTITVENGQSAEFKFDLELAAGHNYGPGTTLTYTLPDIFENITFPTGIKFGDVGTISKNGNEIVITFNEEIRDPLDVGVAFEPNAFFNIGASFDSGNTKWEDTISLPGKENIKLNFEPKSGGQTVSKTGSGENSNKNSKYIDWTVTVNTDAKATGVQTFIDKLTGEHTFDKNTPVTVAEIPLTPAGQGTKGNPVNVTPAYSNFDKEMQIALPDTTHKGYEIKYRTLVGDAGNVDRATFNNTATTRVD